ncbi:MAG: hypothetical protein PVJ85_14780 [Anaerolineae bacterium]
MALNLAHLKTQVRGFAWSLPQDAEHQDKPFVVLLHGLGGDRDDWIDPFQDRNWPYDHRRGPTELDLGEHSRPPFLQLPGIPFQQFLSPKLKGNERGAGGSDDRSWWHALVTAGFPVFAYSQRSGLLLPLDRGPVDECKRFLELLQRDVLSQPDYQQRQVVIVGHSRGGLIGRAVLSEPDVKAGTADRFPDIKGLITIASPHQGSNMALVDDVLIGALDKIQSLIPDLPHDVGAQLIETLKTKIDNYVGVHGDEIEPDSAFFQTLESREPILSGVRCISVGGTLPRLLRIYIWAFTASSWVPRWSAERKLVFRWQAKPIEAKGASPFPDGLPLRVLGLDPSEIMRGRGDGLTADKRCQFPASFQAEAHLSFPVSHAEELWDEALQTDVVQRLRTFC